MSKKVVKKREFKNNEGLNLNDPHHNAVTEIDNEQISKLHKVKKTGTTRFHGDVSYAKRSTVTHVVR